MQLYHTCTWWCWSNDHSSSAEKYFTGLEKQKAESSTVMIREDIISPVSADTFPVMEHFYTLQGEGYHQGRAAYFVRLGGCDVGCVWCDVKESWDASIHPKMSIDEILESIKKTNAKLI